MSRGTATPRLKRDYLDLKQDPIPYIVAEPLPSNILEWHYVIKGPKDSPYQDGYYHGKMEFRHDFPFSPPSFYMLTPNGRFNINTKLCLSISDFHPNTWNPSWSISTLLTGLLSFMLETTPTYGSIKTTSSEKRKLAGKSLEFNLKNAEFCELFPEIVGEIQEHLKQQKNKNNNSDDHTNAEANKEVNEANLDRNGEKCWYLILICISFFIFGLINYYDVF